MAELLQANQPVQQIRNALAAAVLEAACELLLAQGHGHLLVRDRVAECEVERCDRERVRVRLSCEQGDDAWGVFQMQQGTDYAGEYKRS